MDYPQGKEVIHFQSIRLMYHTLRQKPLLSADKRTTPALCRVGRRLAQRHNDAAGSGNGNNIHLFAGIAAGSGRSNKKTPPYTENISPCDMAVAGPGGVYI